MADVKILGYNPNTRTTFYPGCYYVRTGGDTAMLGKPYICIDTVLGYKLVNLATGTAIQAKGDEGKFIDIKPGTKIEIEV